MDGLKLTSNIWFWLFYYALPFCLKYVIRIVTVCVLKLSDKIPLRTLVSPLFDFIIGESKKFVTGVELTEIDGSPTDE